MRRTHVHVSDSGSVWIIHEDPYNMQQEDEQEKEINPGSAITASSPNIDVVLHADGQNDTLNFCSAQTEGQLDKEASDG